MASERRRTQAAARQLDISLKLLYGWQIAVRAAFAYHSPRCGPRRLWAEVQKGHAVDAFATC